MAGLDDYINIVEQSHSKTASAKPSEVSTELLTKLAAELSGDHPKVVTPGTAEPAAAAASTTVDAQAPVKPAEASVAEANPAVLSATDAVAIPQEVAAGATPGEKEAGEVPASIKPNEGVAISTQSNDGETFDANALHKVPEAVAEAAKPQHGGMPEKTASDKTNAEQVGVYMANSFTAQMEKNAHDEKYATALNGLNSVGMLEGYNIKS